MTVVTLSCHRISRNSDKESGDEANDDVDKDVGMDDEEWDTLQADIERPEAILEAKSKESHPVHAPHFPLVTICSKYWQSSPIDIITCIITDHHRFLSYHICANLSSALGKLFLESHQSY